MISNWAHGNNKKSLVEKYTEDLSQITSKIHEIENKLRKTQDKVDYLQYNITYYGSGLTFSLFAYVFWNFKENKMAIFVSTFTCIFLIIICKLGTNKASTILRNKRNIQLGKLRALHQKKLEKLKEDTNFNATNSIIQRFSSGEQQSDDIMLLLGDEINDKYKELAVLKEELIKLKESDSLMKNKEERDKWFDKVIGIIAGGNDLNSFSKPILCPKCSKHFGSYRIGDKPIKYICPACGWKLDELEPTADVSHGTTNLMTEKKETSILM